MESADFVTTGAIMVHPLNIKPEIISNKKGKILFDGVFMVKALYRVPAICLLVTNVRKTEGEYKHPAESFSGCFPKTFVISFYKKYLLWRKRRLSPAR